MSDTVRLRVAICGGGISGLTLALALASYKDIEIDIYEATARYEEIGAGIAIWGRGLTALHKIDSEGKIRAQIPPPLKNSLEMRRADLPDGGEYIGILELGRAMGLHRAQFLDLLVQTLIQTDRANSHFGKRCVSYTQRSGVESNEDPVILHFSDGTSATCDVLVGCDGIKSAIRGELLQENSEAIVADDNGGVGKDLKRFAGTRFTGTVAYRALVKLEDLKAIDPTHGALTAPKSYGGKNKHIVTYPVAGRFLNLVAYSSEPTRQEEWRTQPWTVEAKDGELQDQFKGFESEVQSILKCVDRSSRWAMYDVEPLDFWSKGNVTLVGDSAHAMMPVLGTGGGQSLEDVFILSRLLGSPNATRGTVPSVLQAYERVRMPRANKVICCTQEARRAFEYMEEFGDGTGEEVIETARRLTRWLWEDKGEPEDDLQEAEKVFQELISAKNGA